MACAYGMGTMASSRKCRELYHDRPNPLRQLVNPRKSCIVLYHVVCTVYIGMDDCPQYVPTIIFRCIILRYSMYHLQPTAVVAVVGSLLHVDRDILYYIILYHIIPYAAVLPTLPENVLI